MYTSLVYLRLSISAVVEIIMPQTKIDCMGNYPASIYIDELGINKNW